MKQAITLIETQTNESVAAELIRGISQDVIEQWANSWNPAFDKIRAQFERNGVPREKWPEDAHWDWSNKMSVTKGCLAFESYCILANGSLEGLMLLNNTKYSCLPDQRGKELVYIEFLATAPWNRKELCHPRKYRAVGSILAQVAIELSVAYEFGGRIALHSLPKSADFYRNTLKMTELGPDPRHQNLIYFELTPEQASRFLRL
jgi:hypothetical protein